MNQTQSSGNEEDLNAAVSKVDLINRAIELSSVSFNYGSGPTMVEALKGVSISIDRGEFVSIMGPSGSGKSTLVHVAAGLVAPASGEVRVSGKLVRPNDRRTWALLRRHSIGVVFQRLNLIPTLSALENVMVPLILDGMNQHQAAPLAKDALEKVEFKHQSDRLPSELSGGEQQRVAIARAVVATRSLVLADEPTGALDTTTSDQVMRLLRNLSASGTAVVMVTHDSRFASWSDRVLSLRDGQLEASPPDKTTPETTSQ